MVCSVLVEKFLVNVSVYAVTNVDIMAPLLGNRCAGAMELIPFMTDSGLTSCTITAALGYSDG